MGLDISFLTNVKLIQEETDQIECLWELCDSLGKDQPDINITVLYSNNHFPLHFSQTGIYSYDVIEDYVSCSYSGWSTVRDELARAIGYNRVTESECIEHNFSFEESRILPYQAKVFVSEKGPLHELIYFSDCEGTIGTNFCKKIYTDLLEVDVSKLSDERFVRIYYKLLHGFKVVSENNGVTNFH